MQFYIGISKLDISFRLRFVGLSINEEDDIQEARSSRIDSKL